MKGDAAPPGASRGGNLKFVLGLLVCLGLGYTLTQLSTVEENGSEGDVVPQLVRGAPIDSSLVKNDPSDESPPEAPEGDSDPMASESNGPVESELADSQPPIEESGASAEVTEPAVSSSSASTSPSLPSDQGEETASSLRLRGDRGGTASPSDAEAGADSASASSSQSEVVTLAMATSESADATGAVSSASGTEADADPVAGSRDPLSSYMKRTGGMTAPVYLDQFPALSEYRKVAHNGGEYLDASFRILGGYYYEVPYPDFFGASQKPPDPPKDQIPKPILELNGEKVAIQGFMVPLDVSREGIETLVLLRTQVACCFGDVVAMNEWIYVEVDPEKPVTFYTDLPITVYGTLEVGEEIEDGVVLSVYRMKADDVVKPETG